MLRRFTDNAAQDAERRRLRDHPPIQGGLVSSLQSIDNHLGRVLQYNVQVIEQFVGLPIDVFWGCLICIYHAA